MNKRVFKQDMIAGLIVLAIALFAFAFTFEMPGSAPLFPRIASSILFLLGLVLVVTSYTGIRRGRPTDRKPVLASVFYNPALTLLIVIAYIIGMRLLGFYVSSLLMIAGMMYFLGARSVKSIILVTVIVTAVVYLIFTVQLRVPLPRGLLM